MKVFLEKFIGSVKNDSSDRFQGHDQIKRQVAALYSLLANLYGSDKLVLRAGKLEALQFMRSERLEERVLALQKLVFEDPTYDTLPAYEEIPAVLEEIEEEIADNIARRTVEDKLEKKISEKLQQRHEEYIKEIKMQVIKENTGAENAQTLKKLAILEKLEQRKLSPRRWSFYARPRSRK
jgi:ATP-dependent Lon protease